MLRTLIQTAFALLCMLTMTAQATDASRDGRAMTAAFYARQFDVLWTAMAEPMHKAMGSPQALAAFHDQVGAQLGKESAVLEESASPQGLYTQYRRVARFDKAGTGATVLVSWTFDQSGRIIGFAIAPHTAAPALQSGYQTRNRLRLPFEQAVTVVWGGRTIEQNQHAAFPAQRHALDLLMVRDGATRQGPGAGNEPYHCFGKTIVAPAGGRVVRAADGVADNLPGTMNSAELLGNYVVIDHGQGEFSLLAHLRRGSLTVAQGAQVRAGQPVGQCGNSGNSSEPHLHYQLQDGPEFGVAASLPAQFSDYIADTVPVARGEPVKGQLIWPQP